MNERPKPVATVMPVDDSYKGKMLVTSREQSYKLSQIACLSLQTADMMWVCVAFDADDPNAIWEVMVRHPWMQAPREPNSYPAWSLGALWRLCDEEKLVFETGRDSAETVLDALVERILKSYPKQSSK